MRRLLRTLVPREYRKLVADAQLAPFRIAALERRIEFIAGRIIREEYGDQAQERAFHSIINRHEFSVYSQNGEDGILLFLFSIIGTSSRRFIEFGTGDGRECNSANLLMNFGWQGVLLECVPDFVGASRQYFDYVLSERASDVNIVHATITAENIDAVLREGCPYQDVDLISIDIDGNDYWVWNELSIFRPRVFVVEYAAVMGAERAITVEYDPVFSRFEKHSSGLYAGASLSALVKLGREKGYSFVGCNMHGVNAFFVRSDLMKPPLEALTAEQGYYSMLYPGLACIAPDRFAEIAHLPFVEV